MQEKPNLRQGRFSAADIDDRWMADLADLTAQPSGEFQYILVALNVFSKQLWARPLRHKPSRRYSKTKNHHLVWTPILAPSSQGLFCSFWKKKISSTLSKFLKMSMPWPHSIEPSRL
jgi:hypothetical protein